MIIRPFTALHAGWSRLPVKILHGPFKPQFVIAIGAFECRVGIGVLFPILELSLLAAAKASAEALP